MSTTQPLRVLVLAADPLARAGLAALLATQPTLTVVAQLTADATLLNQLEVYRPDLLLWDLGWSPTPINGLLNEALDQRIPLLVLVADENSFRHLWSLGVRNLLLRERSVDALTAALHAILHGLQVIEPIFAAQLPEIALPPAQSTAQPTVDALTARELEVLQALADGLSNKQIARQLAISEHTVKFHVNAVMSKLSAQSRTDAVMRATRAGLILI